jgi:chromosome segregation ATPase
MPSSIVRMGCNDINLNALIAEEVMALRCHCAELEKKLQAKSLLEAQVSHLERKKVRMTTHFNKTKLDKAVAVEYMKGSHAELTSAKQEIERLHAELRAAENCRTRVLSCSSAPSTAPESRGIPEG